MSPTSAGHVPLKAGWHSHGDLAEMDGLLQDAWRPINLKYAADPEPHFTVFSAGMGTMSCGLP